MRLRDITPARWAAIERDQFARDEQRMNREQEHAEARQADLAPRHDPKEPF